MTSPIGLADRLQPELERLLGRRGRLRVHGASPADAELAAAEEYLDPRTLRRSIDRCVEMHGISASAGFDLRAAASRWSRHYAGAVMQAPLVAMAFGYEIDVSLERCQFVTQNSLPEGIVLGGQYQPLAYSERLRTPVVNIRGEVDLGQIRKSVLGSAIEGNLVRIIEAVRRLVKVSERMLWCNVAEQVEMVYEHAAPIGPAAAELAADHELIFNSDILPGCTRPNPLRRTLVWERIQEADFAATLSKREVCCITYSLPDRPGRFCWNCPLVEQERRIAMARTASSEGMGPAAAALPSRL